MTWRPRSVLRAPLAAVVLATLAVVQAGGGANVTSTSAVPGGVSVDGGVTPERPQEVAVAVLLALATTAPVAVAGLWPVVAAVLSALAMVLCLLAQVPPTVGGVLALGILCMVLGARRNLWLVAALVAPFVVCVTVPGVDRTAAVLVLSVVVLAGAGGATWR